MDGEKLFGLNPIYSTAAKYYAIYKDAKNIILDINDYYKKLTDFVYGATLNLNLAYSYYDKAELFGKDVSEYQAKLWKRPTVKDDIEKIIDNAVKNSTISTTYFHSDDFDFLNIKDVKSYDFYKYDTQAHVRFIDINSAKKVQDLILKDGQNILQAVKSGINKHKLKEEQIKDQYLLEATNKKLRSLIDNKDDMEQKKAYCQKLLREKGSVEANKYLTTLEKSGYFDDKVSFEQLNWYYDLKTKWDNEVKMLAFTVRAIQRILLISDFIKTYDILKNPIVNNLPPVIEYKGESLKPIKDPEYRALGGPVNSGQVYLVGEEGPELFVSNTSGTIIPNHQLGGGIGSFVGGFSNGIVEAIGIFSGKLSELVTKISSAVLKTGQIGSGNSNMTGQDQTDPGETKPFTFKDLMKQLGSQTTQDFESTKNSIFDDLMSGKMPDLAQYAQSFLGNMGNNLFSGLGMLIPGIGPLFGGLFGGLFNGLFGGNELQKMTVMADSGDVQIDFASANFKNVTLPTSYMGKGVPEFNATAPVYNIYNTVHVSGTVAAQRDLEKSMYDVSVQAIKDTKVSDAKWQRLKIQTVGAV